MGQVSGSSLLRLEGFDELIDRLDAMPAELGTKRKVLGKALRRGGKIIQDEAVKRAPKAGLSRWVNVDTSPASKKYGPLVNNIKTVVVDENADGAEAQVGVTSHGFYGRFPEYGTAHQPRKPWLGPSFDSKLDEAVEAVAETLDEGIQESFNG